MLTAATSARDARAARVGHFACRSHRALASLPAARIVRCRRICFPTLPFPSLPANRLRQVMCCDCDIGAGWLLQDEV